MNKIIFASAIGLSFLAQTHAYIAGKISNEAGNPNKPVHVVVAGTAHEAGFLFQQAALTKALKYKELYPEDQILFFTQTENEYNAEWLKKRGVLLLHSDNKNLTTEKLVDTLKTYNKIRSLDFYTHSALSYGLQLSSINKGRIGAEDKTIGKLVGHFSEDATITLNGCNSGFKIAPIWSKRLGVPVYGSLTSTDFQELHTNNQYYFNNPESKHDSPIADKNDLSFSNAPSCKLGLCVRMKPVNGPYNGYWGSYNEGGLSFYKNFCNGVSEEKCLKGYKKIATSFISTRNLNIDHSLEAYKEVVQDMLCPINAKRELREECVKALIASEIDETFYTYNPFRGKQLQCSHTGCNYVLDCPRFKKECYLVNTAKEEANTLVKEYLTYLKAFKY